MEIDGNANGQHVLSELRTFIAGASRPNDVHHASLVKTAVSLLKSLPAAREAALEYFGVVFHNYVSKYLTLLEVRLTTFESHSIILSVRNLNNYFYVEWNILNLQLQRERKTG